MCQGQRSRVYKCDKCGGCDRINGGKCKQCDGEGITITFLEMSDEERALARGVD